MSINEPVLNVTENFSLPVDVEPPPMVVAVSQPESSPANRPVMPLEEPDELPLSIDTQGMQSEHLPSNVLISNFRPIVTEDLSNSVSGLSTPTALAEHFSSTSSLSQLNKPISSFQSFSTPPPISLSLSTLPTVSPLPPELTMPLQDYHTISSIATVAHVDTSRLESELAKKDAKIDELKYENEGQKAQVSEQRVQIESYKQQLLLLQQQVTQVAVQQQKHEQEKMASSGQQAVLMQLLQQQQGMFSQQQSQLENMSKVTEAHRKEQQELESSYKQALAVEKEQKNALQNQLTHQTQEIHRFQQQLQSQAQQYQTLQMQLQQYHTQIQERDKQLVAFRDQHKTILQSMDQKHQAKIAQLMQQLQDFQAEVKKLRTLKQPGMMTPLPQVPTQQFIRQQQMIPPQNVPGQMALPVRQPTSFSSQLPPNPTPPITPAGTPQQGYNPPNPNQTQRHPLTPQSVRQPPQNHPQSFSGGSGPPRGLPPPLQPTPPQGYARQDSQPRFQGFQQQGQNFQTPQQGEYYDRSFHFPITPSYIYARAGGPVFQPPPGQQQVPTSQPSQSAAGPMTRPDTQQQFRSEQQPPSKEGPPTSSYGFVPRQDGAHAWSAGGSMIPRPPSTSQGVGPQPTGQRQYGEVLDTETICSTTCLNTVFPRPRAVY